MQVVLHTQTSQGRLKGRHNFGVQQLSRSEIIAEDVVVGGAAVGCKNVFGGEPHSRNSGGLLGHYYFQFDLLELEIPD